MIDRRAAVAGPAADVVFLRRIERTAVAFVVLATLAGGVLGGLTWAGGILAGGLLAAISYWAIRSSVDALVAVMGPGAAPVPPAAAPEAPDAALAGDELAAPLPTARVSYLRVAVSVLGRHALLGVVAYVIIARLRLHPVGVLLGASAVVLAAAREAVRRPG